MRQVIEKHDNWADMRARFRWRVPDAFNIAERCCDAWARAEPDRVAIRHVGGDGRVDAWTYGQLDRAASGLALALAARGIGPGDRVAVLLPQCPEVMATHFAAQKLGAVVLPLFTLFGVDALTFRLADSGVAAIVTDNANLGRIMDIRADLPDLATIISTGPAVPPVLNLADEIARANRALPAAATRADDPATLIYTSGTTGPPKGVLHAHRFLLGHLPSIETTHLALPRRGDCGWTPADWAWIGGLMDLAIPCLYFGVPLVSHRMRKFDADAAFALIAGQGIRNMFLPPTALKLMRQARAPAGLAIRSISSGGESLGADLLDWGCEKLGVPISEIYGQTECNLVLSSVDGLMERRPGSMGRAVPGVDVAVIGEDGAPVPAGQLGEIAVRRGAPAMFLGYWQQPEKTAAKFTGDWMRTGDLGVCDADGYFAFVSRDDDVINSAGYRIGPVEIENCLTGHPAVVMAAAVGQPDAARGEVVRAFVVLREGDLTGDLRDELADRVRTRIGAHLVPRVITQADALPMTATGKIMRSELRERE